MVTYVSSMISFEVAGPGESKAQPAEERQRFLPSSILAPRKCKVLDIARSLLKDPELREETDVGRSPVCSLISV